MSKESFLFNLQRKSADVKSFKWDKKNFTMNILVEISVKNTDVLCNKMKSIFVLFHAIVASAERNSVNCRKR